MSKIALSGNANGSGTFTIASPNSNSDRTLNLPDAGGTVVSDTATQTLTNKTLTSPTLTTPNINSAQFATVTGTAPIYPCRAWVNFNGTGTVAIRGSGNVSSITDLGTGIYRANFTNNLPDTNGIALVSAKISGQSSYGTLNTGIATTDVTVETYNTSGTQGDANFVYIGVFR